MDRSRCDSSYIIAPGGDVNRQSLSDVIAERADIGADLPFPPVIPPARLDIEVAFTYTQ